MSDGNGAGAGAGGGGAAAATREPAKKVFKPAGFGKRHNSVWYIPPQYVGESAPTWLELREEITYEFAVSNGVANYESLLVQDDDDDDDDEVPLKFGQVHGNAKVRLHF